MIILYWGTFINYNKTDLPYDYRDLVECCHITWSNITGIRNTSNDIFYLVLQITKVFNMRNPPMIGKETSNTRKHFQQFFDGKVLFTERR